MKLFKFMIIILNIPIIFLLTLSFSCADLCANIMNKIIENTMIIYDLLGFRDEKK